MKNKENPILTFTRIDFINPAVAGKTMTINPDGSVCKSGGGPLNDGHAYVETVEGIAGFADYLAALEPGSCALTFGLPKVQVPPDGVRVLSGEREDAAGNADAIARKRKHFEFKEVSGIAAFDYDPPDEASAMDLHAILDVLVDVVPAFDAVALVWWCSSSSYIFREDETEVAGLRGQRLYVPILDMSDWERAASVIQKRLVLAGYGHILISGSGGRLLRTTFDASMAQPERLDYAAGAVCGEGLCQKRPDPVIHTPDGLALLDTREGIPDLTSDEDARYQEIVAALKADAEPEAKAVRSAWRADREEQAARAALGDDAGQEDVDRWKASPEGLEVARRLQALVEGVGVRPVLLLDYAIALGRDETVTVRDVLMDPDRFKRQTVCDPLEPEYRGWHPAATLFPSSRTMVTHSHGQKRVFVLCTDAEFRKIVDARLAPLIADPEATAAQVEADDIPFLSPRGTMFAWWSEANDKPIFKRLSRLAGSKSKHNDWTVALQKVRDSLHAPHSIDLNPENIPDDGHDPRSMDQKIAAGDAKESDRPPWDDVRDEGPDGFPEPSDPFTDFAAPPFPLDTLPAVVREYVETAADEMGVEPAGVALSLLTVAASAAGNVNRIHVNDKWKEYATIWGVLVGDPGTNKTAVQELGTDPLSREQVSRGKAYIREAAAHDVRFTKEVVAQAKAMGLNVPQPPAAPPTLITSDVTMEKAGILMAEGQRGFLLHSDELTGFIGAMEKYGRGGVNPDRGFWLKAWSGGSHTVDRVSRDTSQIESTAMSLIGGIQPGKIRELNAKGIDLGSDGLAQRFVFAFMADVRIPDAWTEESARSRAASEGFAALMRDLLAAPTGPITLAPDAKDAVLGVWKGMAERAKAFAALDQGLAGWMNKAHGLVVKMSGILRLIEGRGEDRVIRLQDLKAAERMVLEYFLHTAHGFFCHIATGERPDAVKVAHWLLTSEKVESGGKISMTDLKRGPNPLRGMDTFELRKAISPLIAGGWLQPAQREKVGFETAWLLNPKVREKFSREAENHRQLLRELAQKLKKHAKAE